MCSWILTLLPVFVAILPQQDEPKVIAASEWCQPAESHDRALRARWLLLEGRSRAFAGPGQELLLYVELENANSAWGEPLRVYFDPAKGLEFDVVDHEGKSVPASPTFGSGGDVAAAWITVPYDSSVRLRANPGGYGKPADVAIALPLRPRNGQMWQFQTSPESDYFVTGKLVIAPPTDDTIEHRDDWRGTLEFPPVRLDFKKQ